ncbi:unnamed protein product [Rotaria magnacalcarata]|uniref:Alcohol dehydrogenase n=3 Tax=Rotaria magnacalcarata TaxID=392030 RepID=A0A816US30_9BILA|nr:unnamed protein product [Rotaria magnacalcarata]CAF1528190.1 unnamed protein product [Rotaria magnacalcarata]CAF2089537.1 unnamed protein product [Rotaria magnacalcarata]CAF2111181.1 unnamed protein product [Rotaria magnacalcarata]CAF2208871.1 unnamed protein product [Rotaria magnacalcarata]
MQAVIFKGVRNIAVENRPIPICKNSTDVIIKVHVTALCGSDLHIYRGHEFSETEVIMGHEFVGEIIEIGLDVKNFKTGDKIIVPFSTCCGNCFYCAKGLTSRCEKSQVFGTPLLDGGQAEYVRIPFADSTAFLAPKEIPDDLAFLMADIFPTGYFAAKNAWTMLSDQERQASNLTVCIIGCGPVGLCAVIAACNRFPIVYAIDSIEERLEEAKNHGAIPININDDPISVIKKATEGRGADAALEVVGHADALKLAYDLIRPCGVIASVGVQQDAFPFTGPQVYDKNVRLQFGRCPVRALFPEALQLFSEKQDQFKNFISHRMSLSDADKAYELFDKRLARKVIFDLRT